MSGGNFNMANNFECQNLYADWITFQKNTVTCWVCHATINFTHIYSYTLKYKWYLFNCILRRQSSNCLVRPSLSKCKSKAKSHCDWRSVSQSVSQSVSLGVEPAWGSWPDIYYCWTSRFCFLWGALSDERMGLSFLHAIGPCQRIECIQKQRKLLQYLGSQIFLMKWAVSSV
jgi:hypothetical protein